MNDNINAIANDIFNEVISSIQYDDMNITIPTAIVLSSIKNTISELLISVQNKYENTLQHLESKERFYIRNIIQMRNDIDILTSRLNSMSSTIEEYNKVKLQLNIIVENGEVINNSNKDNEILILRAENSNLKTIISSMTETLKKNNTIEENVKSHNIVQSEAGIHINISDVSHSNVYIGSPFTNHSKTKKKVNTSTTISSYTKKFSPMNTSVTKNTKTRSHMKQKSMGYLSSMNNEKKKKIKPECLINTFFDSLKRKKHKKNMSSCINVNTSSQKILTPHNKLNTVGVNTNTVMTTNRKSKMYQNLFMSPKMKYNNYLLYKSNIQNSMNYVNISKLNISNLNK